MKLHELKSLLRAHPTALPRFILPGGDQIPAHFHLTEVGYVAKKFVDCGGTFRDRERAFCKPTSRRISITVSGETLC
jgi:hypothetical protein